MSEDKSVFKLSLTGKRWRRPSSAMDIAALHPSLPHWAQRLLHGRGLGAPETVSEYLDPSLKQLCDPNQLADMPIALEILTKAIRTGRLITVYGDYDVDGVCATAVLVEFLRSVGANARYYLPDRRTEGYGLNRAAIEELTQCDTVLVTADCGITAHEEIALARANGADVVVVDHHHVPETMPNANANLNPKRPDCPYPFKELCAAGVAFMLVIALRRALRDSGMFNTRQEPDVRDLLDLVALATVADMVPIRSTNRVLVAAGLKRMASNQRLGLQALFSVARVDPSRMNASDLGFRIGPRINARGRMSHAASAVDLLLTDDAALAKQLAQELDDANVQRRATETETVNNALARMSAGELANSAAIVMYDASWHPGVLGLVASRLVSRFHRPAIVIGEGGKGSGRTIEGLNLHQAISESAQHLIRFGGHAAAAGVTIAPENVDAFRQAIDTAVRKQIGAPPYVAELKPDIETDAQELSLQMIDVLDRLAPFGQGNPDPLFMSSNVRVRSKGVVATTHLKLRLGEDGRGHDAIAFGMGDLAEHIGDCVDVLYCLERNTYQGRTQLQLRVVDIANVG